MTELPRELRVLIDKQEIRDHLMRYCRGVDRCDVELMRGIFHEDGTAFGSNAWEFCDHFVPANEADTTFTVHILGNILVDVDGDTAHSESYFVTYVGREDQGQQFVDAFCGRYVDRWERRAGQWGVVERRTVHEWSRANLAGLEPFPVPASEEGTFVTPIRGREDVSFHG
jgi:SnoaL-like protein